MATFDYRVGPRQWNNADARQQETLAELFKPSDFDWVEILSDRVCCSGDVEGVAEFVLEFLEAYLPGSTETGMANALRDRLDIPIHLAVEE
jgi:hypothetical protein